MRRAPADTAARSARPVSSRGDPGGSGMNTNPAVAAMSGSCCPVCARDYEQQPLVAAAGAVAADPHPHPVPPPDFTSASRAQHAFVPAGAGPPQQIFGAAALGVVDAARTSPRGSVVCVCLASIMAVSWSASVRLLFVVPLWKTRSVLVGRSTGRS